MLISRGVIFDVLYCTLFDHESRYFNATETFCQFCGKTGNDLEFRLEVI